MMATTLMIAACLMNAQMDEAGRANNNERKNVRCGSYTLYVGLKAIDVPVGPYQEFEAKLGEPSPAGYSLGKLAEVAESYGLRTLGVQTTLENLQRRGGRFVCIAHLNGDHFVNVAGVSDGVVSLIDAPRAYSLPIDTFNSQWSGTALLISRGPLVREEELPRPLDVRWLLAAALAGFALYTGWVFLRGRATPAPGRRD
jgi:ABC-type bacteriocin/lantibiotic exporter with double-glycine peptidase domain